MSQPWLHFQLLCFLLRLLIPKIGFILRPRIKYILSIQAMVLGEPNKLWSKKKYLFFLTKKLGNLTTMLLNNLGMVDGNGNQASFNSPQGIYFDPTSKNLLIADTYFYSIRKMNQSGLMQSKTHKKGGYFFSKNPKIKKDMLLLLLEVDHKEPMMDMELLLNFINHIALQWILLEIFMLEIIVQLE